MTSIKGHKSHLYFGGKKRGTLEVGDDGIIKIQITDMNWFNSRDEIGGSFTVEVQLDKVNDEHPEGGNVVFPGTTGSTPISKKKHVTAGPKTITNAEKNDDGSYTLSYEASLKVDDQLDNLTFTDTLGGSQTLDGGVTVSPGSATTQITDNVFVTTFTGPVSPGTYKVTYNTKVSKDVYTDLQSGGSDWSTKNTCKWDYEGTSLPGGDTTYEIKKEPNSPPTVNKTATISNDVNNDGKLDPGDSVTYNITITGKQLADMGISDSMTDLQVVQGEPTVTVSSGADPAAYNDWINAIKSQITNSADSNYSQYSTTVIGNNDATKIPKVAPFNTDNETTITITYTTKVINQEAATAAGIYG